jgi:glucose-6-phosphate 1-epimerase
MDKPQTADKLNEQFGIPSRLAFETGGGGLVRAVVNTGECSGGVFLYGAHVTDYQPAGHEPALFVSASSEYAEGKAIRGGVPVCFPWFGPHATDRSAPSHGPARITTWELTGVDEQDDAVTMNLTALFEPYRVCQRVTFGAELAMSLSVQNTSDSPATFEAALHTYFTVADVKQIDITGLAGVDYLDKVDGQKRKNQSQSPIRFEGETDRVYVDTQSSCILTDPVLARRITVAKSGSNSTVVWNPWTDKAQAMKDFGDDEWVKMVCIETANAGPNAVTLESGGVHEMSATIGVTNL